MDLSSLFSSVCLPFLFSAKIPIPCKSLFYFVREPWGQFSKYLVFFFPLGTCLPWTVSLTQSLISHILTQPPLKMSIQVEFQMFGCGQAVWSLECIFSLRTFWPFKWQIQQLCQCHACNRHSNRRHRISENDLWGWYLPGLQKKTSQLPWEMAPRKFGEGIRGQRMGSYKGHLPRAEKENDKRVALFKSPATLHIFAKLLLRKMPSSKKNPSKTGWGEGERNQKQRSQKAMQLIKTQHNHSLPGLHQNQRAEKKTKPSWKRNRQCEKN